MKRILLFFVGCYLFSNLSCLNEENVDSKYPKIYTDPIENITPDGARFTARIDYSSIDQLTDFGFIWGEDSKLSAGTVTLSADNQNEKVFSTDVRSSLIAQRIYYVRSYVKKSGKTVFGNIVFFKSLGSEGPKVTGLVPSVAAFGDTVRVIGRNFTSNSKLRYGNLDISSSILKAEKSKITFILPSSLPDSPAENFVSVSIDGNSSKSPLALKLDLERILPKILSITPLTIRACDTVTIRGKNLIFENLPIRVGYNQGEFVLIKTTKESLIGIVKVIPKNDIYFSIFNGRFSTSSQGIDLIELRPEVVSISPLIYKSKDIITVKVKNFPYCDGSIYAIVRGSYVNLDIIKRSKDELQLQLPEGCFGATNIVLIVPSSNYLNTQEFETPILTPEPPEVYSIEPSHGTFGDEIIVRGRGLKGYSVNILDTISTSASEIRGILTQNATIKDNGYTDVTIIGCGDITKADAFRYDPVEILDFNPKIITSRSQQIVITGRNFSTSPFVNTLTIGSYTTDFLVGTNNGSISVTASQLFPDITRSVNESVFIKVKNSLGSQVTSSIPLQISYGPSWIRQSDFPNAGIYLGISFSLTGKGYVGINSAAANFWQYDPTLDQWVEKARYPGRFSGYRLSATGGGKAYVGLGDNSNNEWWEYDPRTDAWARRDDYPGSATTNGFAFEIGNKVFVGGGNGGRMNEFWQFDPITNAWARKADMPPYNISGTINFGFKGKGYFYATSSDGARYENEYDPISDEWTSRQIGYYERSANNNYMVFQDYVIIGGESLDNFNRNVFLKIVPATGDIQVADYAGIYRKGQIGFAIGNYGYWGLGINTTNYQASFEIWRFDPSAFR
jgi:hypothetical protein